MTLISDLIPNNTERSRNESSSSNKRRNRKKKMMNQNQSSDENINVTPWKSEAQQQVYSCKLLQALRHVRIGSSPVSGTCRGRAVRETADRVLAVTAKGRTRWSRAILTNKVKIKFMKGNNNRRNRESVGAATRNYIKKPRVSILRLKTKNLPAVQRKTRVLGRLVPGCRKQSLPVVLEEATDYIAALEMQIKAMAALANLLSGGSTGSIAGAGISNTQTPPAL